MYGKEFVCVVLVGAAMLATAAGEQERETFGKWRIGIGAAFNSRVSADLKMRNLPTPAGYRIPSGSSRADALARALARRYDGGGFIDDDSLDNGFDTENWKLPTTSYKGNGHFVLDNAYQEVVGSSVGHAYRDDSENRHQFGISAEISRELWIHDEEDEHRWGVDFAAAFSYFFARDIFDIRGSVTRTDTVRDGKIRTDVNDPDATFDYDQGWDSPVGGMYGYGNSTRTWVNPALGYAGIGDPYDVGGPTHALSTTCRGAANGDYQELEMLFMFRPWYEITDWWRVFAQVGLGVSWGRFDTSFHSGGLSHDEDFSQWDCYGVAGLGTAFRYDDWTLGIDFLARFWRDDLDVNGRYVNGSIDRSDWGFRIMLGYEF